MLAARDPAWQPAWLAFTPATGDAPARIVLPLVAPSVVATALVVFVIDWNLLLVPLVLTSGEIKTVPVAMSDFFTFERELDWPTAAAALVISLAPVVLLVALFHRALQRFALGAIGPESSDE